MCGGLNSIVVAAAVVVVAAPGSSSLRSFFGLQQALALVPDSRRAGTVVGFRRKGLRQHITVGAAAVDTKFVLAVAIVVVVVGTAVQLVVEMKIDNFDFGPEKEMLNTVSCPN